MVPATPLLSTMVVIDEPLQIVCDAGVATALGVGFTTTVAVVELPVQVTPLLVKLGVMVNVTVIAALVALVSEPLIVPLPLAAIPVTPRLLRVQLNTVPPTELPSKIEVMAEPLQIVWLTGLTNTSGMGFTTTVAVMGVPGQLFADGVIVKVTVIGAAVKFVSEPLILPLPLAAIPVTPRLSRVQV